LRVVSTIALQALTCEFAAALGLAFVAAPGAVLTETADHADFAFAREMRVICPQRSHLVALR
jgi:hypothetical protein